MLKGETMVGFKQSTVTSWKHINYKIMEVLIQDIWLVESLTFYIGLLHDSHLQKVFLNSVNRRRADIMYHTSSK